MGWIRKSGSSSMGAQSFESEKNLPLWSTARRRESAEFFKREHLRELWRVRAGLEALTGQ